MTSRGRQLQPLSAPPLHDASPPHPHRHTETNLRRSPAPASDDASGSSADSLTSADSATETDSGVDDGRQRRQRRPSRHSAHQPAHHHSSRRNSRSKSKASRRARSNASVGRRYDDAREAESESRQRTGEKRKHGSSSGSSRARRKKRLTPQKDRGGKGSRRRDRQSPLEDEEEEEERNGSSHRRDGSGRAAGSHGDSDGEEKLEDDEDDEEALAAIITRAPSLNAPALLSRPRYLSIVVQDLQHILLPELDAADIAGADSSSSSSSSQLSPLLSAALTGIRHAACNRSFRRYCAAQFFYSHIDAVFLQHSEFTDCFQLMTAGQLRAAAETQPQPLPTSSLSLSFFDSSPGCVSLSSPLCRLVRRRLGRPRRFSSAFVRDERSKLSEFRSYSRVQQRGQQQLQPPPFLPEAVQRRSVRWRLIQGQDVVAVHPSTGEMHEGVVVGYGQDTVELVANALFHCYRVRFKRVELGAALVEDEQIMTDSRTQTMTNSDSIEDSVLPSVDMLVGAATRWNAKAKMQSPVSSLSSTSSTDRPSFLSAPAFPSSQSSSPSLAAHLIATVLKLLDRKNLLVNGLESMNRSFQLLLWTANTATEKGSSAAAPLSENFAARCAEFVRSYAWTVIQLEKTSQSLEGALMHYTRLRATQQQQQSYAPPDQQMTTEQQDGRRQQRSRSPSPTQSPFLHRSNATASSPSTTTSSSPHSLSSLSSLSSPPDPQLSLLFALTQARLLISAVREELVGEGLLESSWWSAAVQGSIAEELLLLSVGLLLAMQSGDGQTLRELMDVWQRKAQQCSAAAAAAASSSSSSSQLSVGFAVVHATLTALLSSSSFSPPSSSSSADPRQ